MVAVNNSNQKQSVGSLKENLSIGTTCDPPPLKSHRAVSLTLVQMAIKWCIAAWLGVIYNSQATNRKLGGLPARTPIPPRALLLVVLESYMIPSWPEEHKHTTTNKWMFLLFV
jgi:hypothetical protein